jgi:hypothetical protein
VPVSQRRTLADDPVGDRVDVAGVEVEMETRWTIDRLDEHAAVTLGRIEVMELGVVAPRLTDAPAECLRPERVRRLDQLPRKVEDGAGPAAEAERCGPVGRSG